MKLSLVIVLHLDQQCLHSFARQSGPPWSYDGSACSELVDHSQ